MFVREFLPKLWRLLNREHATGKLSGLMPQTSRQLHCLTSDAWNCDQAAATGTVTSCSNSLLLTGHVRPYFSEICITIQQFRYKKMNLKMSPTKSWSFVPTRCVISQNKQPATFNITALASNGIKRWNIQISVIHQHQESVWCDSGLPRVEIASPQTP